MYNYLRKAVPDTRPSAFIDGAWRYLNKNGTVSARQPPASFLRKPVTLTTAAKKCALMRLQAEIAAINDVINNLKLGASTPATLPKTPHHTCPRYCQFFDMCVAEEQDTDISNMETLMYVRQNPYTYGESTDEPASFEMG
jgi:hypothetical protein